MRERHPDFVFWAEAYWDLEPVLVEQGFDACYDKRLYDRLVAPRAGVVGARPPRRRPGLPGATRCGSSRTTTNPAWPPRCRRRRPMAAAVVALTLPGVALLHEGQADGRQVRVPVTLGRRPVEPLDADLRGVVRPAAGRARRRPAAGPLVARSPSRVARQPLVRAARRLDVDGADQRVTSSSSTSRTSGPTVCVRLPDVPAGPVAFTDVLSGESFERDGATIAADGLYVGLDGCGCHVLRAG